MGKSSNETVRFHSVNAFSEFLQKTLSGPQATESRDAEKSPLAPPRKKNFQKNADCPACPGPAGHDQL
jgi:hypothetical protein